MATPHGGQYHTDDGWHFAYRDEKKVLHEIIVQAEKFDDALAEAVEELHAREDNS